MKTYVQVLLSVVAVAVCSASSKAPAPSATHGPVVQVVPSQAEQHRPIMVTGVSPADAILAQAHKALGIRELTGHNDGVEVEQMLHMVGAGKGDPWCAAFVHWCGVKAGYPVFPASAWSPDMVTGGWRLRDHPERSVSPASAFGIYFSSKGRIAHTGLVERDKGGSLVTIEGNTNDAGSREGDGVYRKFRLRSQIYAVRDWTK